MSPFCLKWMLGTEHDYFASPANRPIPSLV